MTYENYLLYLILIYLLYTITITSKRTTHNYIGFNRRTDSFFNISSSNFDSELTTSADWYYFTYMKTCHPSRPPCTSQSLLYERTYDHILAYVTLIFLWRKGHSVTKPTMTRKDGYIRSISARKRDAYRAPKGARYSFEYLIGSPLVSTNRSNTFRVVRNYIFFPRRFSGHFYYFRALRERKGWVLMRAESAGKEGTEEGNAFRYILMTAWLYCRIGIRRSERLFWVFSMRWRVVVQNRYGARMVL